MKKVFLSMFFGYLLIRIHYEISIKKIRKGLPGFLGIQAEIAKQREAFYQSQCQKKSERKRPPKIFRKTYITMPRRI